MIERAVLGKIASPKWPALSDLAEKRTVEIFNREIIDDPRVLYYSYAAVLDNRETGLVSGLRRLEGKISGMRNTEHDGLVELESAKWGEYIGACNTDHGGIIGMHIVPWKMPKFNHLALFDEISNRLAAFSCD